MSKNSRSRETDIRSCYGTIDHNSLHLMHSMWPNNKKNINNTQFFEVVGFIPLGLYSMAKMRPSISSMYSRSGSPSLDGSSRPAL